jgi:formylglycine-generating enzyme
MTLMLRPGSLVRRALGGSATATGFAFVLAGSLASGCLVSFDGYQALESGDAGNASGDAGNATSGGKASGGSKGNGGRAAGGNGGNGATEALGGNGGEPIGGSASGGGAGGKVSGGGNSGNGGNGGASGNGGAGGKVSGGGNSGSGGSAGTAGVSGSAGAGGTPAKNCPVNLEGPPLIEIPKAGGGFFCMDRTEVPNEDYAAFLATNPSTASGQGAECSWNNSYQPDTSVACAAALGAYDPVVRPRVPVSCVDWCDAKRYCAWAGKRLCGAIAGGANPPGSYIDANASQWYRACSKAGAQKFPYGNTWQSMYCVGLDNSGTHPSPVASAPACQGGYDGLFDMSGNVAEWEDSCSANAGATDNCLTRGGSIQSVESTAPSMLCNDSTFNDTTPMAATAKRNTKDELIGFRCCYDP